MSIVIALRIDQTMRRLLFRIDKATYLQTRVHGPLMERTQAHPRPLNPSPFLTSLTLTKSPHVVPLPAVFSPNCPARGPIACHSSADTAAPHPQLPDAEGQQRQAKPGTRSDSALKMSITKIFQSLIALRGGSRGWRGELSATLMAIRDDEVPRNCWR